MACVGLSAGGVKELHRQAITVGIDNRQLYSQLG